MFEIFQNMTHYHWLTLGLLLIILEVFGTAGFMLGFSIASFVVAITMLCTEISWQMQWIMFAVISVLSSIGWFTYQFTKDKKDDSKTQLNKKENQLLGKKITLEEDMPVGKGRLKFTDTTWSVYTEEPLKKGDVVEVVKVDGIILQISKIK